MKVGIVGSEAAKFTAKGEHTAKMIIESLLSGSDVTHVVSGGCHLGGIDIWAEEIADKLGVEKEIYLPRNLSWSGGYKPRNLQIARAADRCYCITVNKLPPEYKGMKFGLCYHCERGGRDPYNHVKSGGCWTVFQAKKQGKLVDWFIVENE